MDLEYGDGKLSQGHLDFDYRWDARKDLPN